MNKILLAFILIICNANLNYCGEKPSTFINESYIKEHPINHDVKDLIKPKN